MNRRSFLKSALAGAGALAGASGWDLASGVPAAAPAGKLPKPSGPPRHAALKLCCQEWHVPGKTTKEKAENILQYGGCGLEFHGIDAHQAEQIRKDLDSVGVGPAACCWGSDGGAQVSADLKRRKKGMEALKRVLEGCGVLGGTGVIWVPEFTGNVKWKHKPPTVEELQAERQRLDKVMAEVLPRMADIAVQAHSRILIEPLNHRESFYINRLEQAAAWCRKINSPGLCMMGDFYHMSKEEKDQEQAFVIAGKWVHHAHIATGKHRILPGQEPHDFRPGFRGLKRIGYRDYCSLECGKKKGTTWKEGIPQAFAELKKQWKEATI